jgi:hypothetical protein
MAVLRMEATFSKMAMSASHRHYDTHREKGTVFYLTFSDLLKKTSAR